MRAIGFLLIFLFPLIGCEIESEEKIVAQVYDTKLTQDELFDKIDRNQLIKDSTDIVNAAIDGWINQQILVYYANKEKLNEQNLIESKVNEYENQLLVHYFQNQLINERLDTIVSDTEIKDYYSAHKADFQLKDYLVKVLYLKVSEDAPELENLSTWYRLRNETDELNIIQYAGLYASNFYFDKANWIYFDEITKEIPLNDINKDRFITKKSEIKFSENNYYYFLNILDYKLKNAVSPIEFEKNNIKKRILNKRVLELRKSINSELINKAKNENAIKKY